MSKKIKLSLRELDIQTKIKKAVEYVNRISANPVFQNPDPSPDEILDAACMLEKKSAELGRLREATKELKNEIGCLELDLDKKITRLASYVENRALGNEEIIRSAGMELRSDPVPVGKPGKTYLLAEVTENEGEIRLKWEKVRGAKIFNIEVSKGGKSDSKWMSIESTTKTRILLKDLTSGTKYWFRIQAIGAGGKGLYSDPISRYIP
jgi:Fibronectin type III domain